MHRGDDRRLYLSDEFVRMSKIERISVANRKEEDIDVADFFENACGKFMSQCAQVTEGDVFTLDDKDRVSSAERAFFIVTKGGESEYCDTFYIVFPRAIKGCFNGESSAGS